MSTTLINRELAAAIMIEYGILSLEAWARAALKRGVFSREWHAHAELDRAKKDLAKFAREDDEYGLPKFGPTVNKDDSGETMYAQRELWSRDDWFLNIKERRDQGLAFLRKALKLCGAYETRFEEPCPLRPTIDRMVDLDYGDVVEAAD